MLCSVEHYKALFDRASRDNKIKHAKVSRYIIIQVTDCQYTCHWEMLGCKDSKATILGSSVNTVEIGCILLRKDHNLEM